MAEDNKRGFFRDVQLTNGALNVNMEGGPTPEGGGGVASLVKTKVLPLVINYTLDFTSLNCFGDIIFKSGDLWEKTTSGIIAPTDGYYEMSLSIVTSAEAERVTTAVAFTLNGNVIPGESSNAYIRRTSLINTASSTLTNVQYFSEGDVIGVATKRTDNVSGAKATIVEEDSMLSVIKLSETKSEDAFNQMFTIERDELNNITKIVSNYDLQVPPQSIEVGDAIKVSDLAQELGYTTKYDDKQYIVMNYEVTDGQTINPTIKQFAEPSSFELQPLFNREQSYTDSVSFPLIAVQDVIGKIYNLKVSTTSELRVRLYRTGVSNYNGDVEGDIIPLSEEDLVAYDVQGEDTLIVDEIIKASQTDINGFDFELKPLTDFVSGAAYRLELSVESGDIQIKGTQITPTFFFPYIKRTFGWQYTNKELAFKDEVPVVNGNAEAEFSHYSFKSGQDNDGFFNDGLIKLSWDSPGNDLEIYMLTEPNGTGDMISLATKGDTTPVSTYITQLNFKYDVYPAGVNATEGLVVWISAEDDESYPSYKIFVHNAGSSYNSNVEVKKIIPKI